MTTEWPAAIAAETVVSAPALDGRHLCLCGFMAAGKTLVGRRLAVRLALPFIDLDERVIAQTGRTPAALIHAEGEAAFRQHEARALEEALNGPQSVIALGGGALLIDASLAAVRARAVLVHLRVSAETARLRALSQPEQARPLLGEDLDETRARLSARAALYAQSDVEVDADGADPSAVTAAVLAGLERLTAR